MITVIPRNLVFEYFKSAYGPSGTEHGFMRRSIGDRLHPRLEVTTERSLIRIDAENL